MKKLLQLTLHRKNRHCEPAVIASRVSCGAAIQRIIIKCGKPEKLKTLEPWIAALQKTQLAMTKHIFALCKVQLIPVIVFALLLGYCFSAYANTLPITIFPLDNYSQDIDIWLSPADKNYETPLVTSAYQQERNKEFYNRLFSTSPTASSPWSKEFITNLLNKNPGVLAQQQEFLSAFSNENKDEKQLGYGENFRLYPQIWIKAIAQSMQLSQLTPPIIYQANNRAITVKNTLARLLPTDDPHFYHYELPGQGYPFDNLAASVIWAGTPIYVVGETADKTWSLVVTASFIAWIHSDIIAKTNLPFIKNWTALAQKQLIAITHTATPILDSNNQLRLVTYVGAVFPFLGTTARQFKVAIPLKNTNGNAQLYYALVDKQYAAKMPLAATPKNFASIIKTLQNRPYGWGNIYFYNDCSAEMQSLYTPFGIWLPRNSSKQQLAGKSINITTQDATLRLNYLMAKGHALMTIIYIGGHVYLYLGNRPNPNDKNHALMAMTYQNIWGLAPKDKSRRAIIGQSVLLPLLNIYPEDPTLNPLYNTKFFVITYLDQQADSKYDINELFFSEFYP